MKKYNKLVRDNIPDIFLKEHSLPVTRTLNDEEYIEELNKKLLNEVNEYLNTNNVEQMVDILEVVRAIINNSDTTYEEIEEKRIKKAKKKGTFEKRVYLEKVIENGD